MYNIAHKKQTKLNDCWYACIQMIKSHRFGTKAKPLGQAVATHRTGKLLGKTIWGNPLAGSDPEFDGILRENNLKIVDCDSYSKLEYVEASLNLYGPMIFGGEFGTLGKNVFTGKPLYRAGHYIVAVGVDRNTQSVLVHDPDQPTGPTSMTHAEFYKYVWRKNEKTVMANDGGYGTEGLTRAS